MTKRQYKMSPKILDKKDLQTRELELIETALDIMKVHGIAGLTMDKVVARVPYSKGTVYNHFVSKEDLLMGVCNDCMSVLSSLFKRANKFDGSPRERVLTVLYGYLLHAQLHPDRFMLVISAKTPNLMERASEKRLTEHRLLEQDLMGALSEQVLVAIDKGQLCLPAHMTVQQVVFANWATAFGAIALLLSHVDQCSGRDGLLVEREAMNNINLLLDGLNWHPLSNEFDYQSTLKRVAEEIFPEELAVLATTSQHITPENV